MLDIEKLREILNSDEGKKSLEDFKNKITNDEIILQSQLDRFHDKYKNNFSEILEKIFLKYESDDYIRKWYSRGIEPDTPLYWFFLEYAKKYGRKCTKKECKKYCNMFTSEIYYINDYYISRMDGQGSFVKIYKEIK